MELLTRAAEMARSAHAPQMRKGGPGVPYITHLESVVSILRGHGCNDDSLLAAAYLHDLIEDQPLWEPALRADLPADVVALVERLTEHKLDANGHLRPKNERFANYVETLAQEDDVSRRARVISCADKIDNARSLVASERAGHGLLTKLRTRPGQHARHFATLRVLYEPVVAPSLLEAFDAAAAELASYVTKWLPGHAVAIAASAHEGAFDKAGAPYILHPLRLMMRADGADAQMVAVLHDVIEDTHWTLEMLADEGFPPRVLHALDRLTRRDGERYEVFIDRVLTDPLATRVKLLDVEDNLDLKRLDALDEKSIERIQRYHHARARLLAALG